MKNYERDTTVKFVAIYFISVFFFILFAGHFYYKQEKNLHLINLAVKMHSYQQHIKQGVKADTSEFSYDILNSDRGYEGIKLPIKRDGYYLKIFPFPNGEYIVVKKDAKVFDRELSKIKLKIRFIVFFVSLFFLFISYFLAKLSLKPMKDMIEHLDNFSKELIHDINTPISSILLNIRGLKNRCPDELLKIKRIEDSTKTIQNLYENLQILLQKEQLEKHSIELDKIVETRVELFKQLYPKIEFQTNFQNVVVETNQKALERIVDNILSNSCKYSKEQNPKVTITVKEYLIMIEDNGKGIKQPQRIFDKYYKENVGGHGIGMYIVHRLATLLDISILIDSKEDMGTKVEIVFEA